MKEKTFNPLLFLSALGAGGIAVMPFAFMNYAVPHHKGLIALEHILPLLQTNMAWLYYFFFIVMIGFGVLHIVLVAILFVKFFKRNKTPEAKEYKADPIRNQGLTTPILAFAMTMNVVIGVVRFFIPALSSGLQDLMMPALIVRLLLWGITMYISIDITKKSFFKSFDFDKITFGWLLVPFTIAMVTVVGAGIAALAVNSAIAHTAAFFTFISLGFGFFLFVTKLITLFQKHFADKNGEPAKQALPSFLIVIPNVTLFAISFFRLGHYFANQTGSHADAFLFFIIVGAFAFETGYLLFGISLLKKYFQQHFFQKEFYVSMRGLVCPIVAYAVLGSFAYAQFFNSSVIYWLVLAMMLVAIAIYLIVAKKNMACGSKKLKCE